MSFNDLNTYNPQHKTWDHVGNILPDVELCEGERPSVEFKPAAWLPVQFRDKYYEEWYVVMPGKAVALDPDGRVMPAQYGLTGASVVYTQNDVDAGVIDVATGQAVTTAKTVVLAALTGARGSSWTLAAAGTVNDASNRSGFMGRFGVAFGDANRKPAIGLAPYGYFQWAGGDGSNPAQLRKHNHMLQHQVAVLCDYVVKLPLVPAQTAAEAVEKDAAVGNLVIGTPETHTRAQAQANARYNATYGTVPVLNTDTVIALALDKKPVAKITPKTLVTLASDNTADDLSGILVNERTAVSAVDAAGDFFVDYEAGVIFIYSSDGATLPTALSGAAGNVTITYMQYEDQASAVSKFASVLGSDLQPGALLKAGANSNLVEWAGSELQDQVIGQVLAIVDDYNEALAKVRTAYLPALGTDSSGSMANATAGSASVNLGQLDQMPGSATGGYTDLTHVAGAVKYVIVNLIGR